VNAKRRLVLRIAQHATQRMVEIDLIVAPRDDQQPASAVDPAADVGEEIERRFVGPMHVFDDHDGWTRPPRQIVEKRREQLVARRQRSEL
jgi:hypothetical protein